MAKTPRTLQTSTTRRMFSTAAVIAAATIFGLTYSLSAPLIALDLDACGYSETFISFNAAMHAGGVLTDRTLAGGRLRRVRVHRRGAHRPCRPRSNPVPERARRRGAPAAPHVRPAMLCGSPVPGSCVHRAHAISYRPSGP